VSAVLAAETQRDTNALFATAGYFATWVLSVSLVCIANDVSILQAMAGRI